MDTTNQAMIRQYRKEDAKAVKSIAYHDDERGSMRAVSAVRCDYYIDHEPQHCFVMTDEFDKPAGYAVCSVDRQSFSDLYPTYLAIVKEEDKKQFRKELRLQKKLLAVPKQYSAHLHISILPSFRGKGGAKALVEALVAHLKEINVSGVYTVADTPSAVAFCERVGFQRILHIDKTHYVYGIKID